MTASEAVFASRTFATAAGATFQAIKSACLWCGHVIKVIAVDYIVPGMKFVWPYLVRGGAYVGSLLITAPGLGSIGLILGIGASAACFALAESKHFEGEEYRLQRILLHVAAVAFAVLGGAAFATGIALGVG